MSRMRLRWFLWAVVLSTSSRWAVAETAPPTDWIDAATGHRVIRLSEEPGSASLYFHQNAYSADGKKLIITTPSGISAVNLQTREIEPVVQGNVRVLVTGRKTGQVYYLQQGTVFASDLHTRAKRQVATIPPELRGSSSIAVNADDTLLVGIARDPEGQPQPKTPPPGSAGGRLEGRWAAGIPMLLYTIDIRTGEVRKIYREHEWTNHLQCSPTDPDLFMFCHEGPWHFVDRIWTIHADGTDLRLMHKRTMEMEIAGHEFFSADGQTIWYDLQTPKSGVFWLAGVEIRTGARAWYHLERKEWSVHFNASPDGKLFAGDGGGPNSVANRSADGKRLNPPGNGQWIYLFRPVHVSGPAGVLPGQGDLIKVGYLASERLVDLSKHDYRLEPNVTFTPDGKWVVFRSNMHGPTHVYAVEVQKANPQP